MRKFADKYPIVFVVLISLGLAFGQYIWLFLVPGLSSSTRFIAAKITEVLFAIFLLVQLKWWKETGFVSKWQLKDFWPYLPLLIIPLLMIVFQLNKFQFSDPMKILLFAFLALMTGFAEETIFRGIALHTLLSKGLMRAVLLSSLIFGLVHFLNLLNGPDLLATTVQVIFAFLFGIAFVAPLLYTGSIWPLIIVHFIQDFVAFWTTGGLTNTATPPVSEIIQTIILIIPFAIYGLWLVKKKIK
jgi:uncharacterized protein